MHASSMEMEATQSPMSVEENHSTSHSFACSSFRESPFVTFFGVKEDGLKEDGLDASTDEANTTGLRDEGSATREKAVMRLKMPKLPLPERSQQSSDDESSSRPKVLCSFKDLIFWKHPSTTGAAFLFTVILYWLTVVVECSPLEISCFTLLVIFAGLSAFEALQKIGFKNHSAVMAVESVPKIFM